MDDTQAACARLPMVEVDEMFYLEQSPPTVAWPRKDTHWKARAVCASCPILAQCADGAFDEAFSFRAGLAPEERASFGGPLLAHTARRRLPSLTRAQVWERISHSTLPVEVMREVLSDRVDLAGPTLTKSGVDDWRPPAP